MDIRQKILSYVSEKKCKYYESYKEYIELFLSNENIILKYNPPVQQFGKYNSFDFEYLSDHFNYGSRKNLIFRKFFEDMFTSSNHTLPKDSEYMDGYGLCEHTKLIDMNLYIEFFNLLNYLGFFD